MVKSVNTLAKTQVYCRRNHKPHNSILVEFEFFTPKCIIQTAVLLSPKIQGVKLSLLC